MQVCKTRTTQLRWEAKRIRKSARKSTQVAKSRKFHAYTVDLRSSCVDLRWVAKQCKSCADSIAYEFKLTDKSPRKLTPQVCMNLALTCVDLRVRLARAFKNISRTNVHFPPKIIILFQDNKNAEGSYASHQHTTCEWSSTIGWYFVFQVKFGGNISNLLSFYDCFFSPQYTASNKRNPCSQRPRKCSVLMPILMMEKRWVRCVVS